MATEKEKEAVRRRLRLKKNRLKMMEMQGSSDKHSTLGSVATGALESVSWGFDDEAIGGAQALGNMLQGKDAGYEEARDQYRAFKKSSQAEDPWAYGIGEYGSMAGQAVLSGGLSLLGKGAAKGAGKVLAGEAAKETTKAATKATMKETLKKLATKEGAKEATKALGKEAGVSALKGGVEGYGRSDADTLEGNLYDVRQAATIGAVAPSVVKGGIGGVKLGGRAAKATAKGIQKAALKLHEKMTPRISKTATKALKGIRNFEPQTADAFEEMLNDPARLEKAIMARETFHKDFPKYSKDMDEFIEELEGGKSQIFEAAERRASISLAKDRDSLDEVVKRSHRVLQENLDQANFRDEIPLQVGSIIRSAQQVLEESPELIKAHSRLSDHVGLKIPGAKGPLDHLKELEPDPLITEILESNVQKAQGIAHLEAKRVIQSGVNWSKQEAGRDSSTGLLRKAQAALNEIAHDEKYTSGKIMKEADEMYKDFDRMARPMIEHLKEGKLGSKTTARQSWMYDAGNSSRTKRGVLSEGMRQYLKKWEPQLSDVGIGPKNLQKLEGILAPVKDAQNLKRIATEGGGSTGKGVIGLALAATLGQATGIPAPLIAAVISPVSNPSEYMRGVHMIRQYINKTPDKKVRAALGDQYPKIMEAIKSTTRRGGIREAPNLYEGDEPEMELESMGTITPRRSQGQ